MKIEEDKFNPNKRFKLEGFGDVWVGFILTASSFLSSFDGHTWSLMLVYDRFINYHDQMLFFNFFWLSQGEIFRKNKILSRHRGGINDTCNARHKILLIQEVKYKR